jgi:hypothetical protein
LEGELAMTEPKNPTTSPSFTEESAGENTVDTETPQHTAVDEEEKISRRKVLKALIATSTLVPLSSKLAAGQAGQEPESDGDSELRIDADKSSIAASIIDKVATDQEFRKRVKAYPVRTLSEMGIILNSDARDALKALSAHDPDVLVKAMLGEEFPSSSGEVVGILPAIRVGTRPGTEPAVRVATNVVIGVNTSVLEVSPEAYVNAISISLTGHGVDDNDNDNK